MTFGTGNCAESNTWEIRQKGNIVEIYYQSDTGKAQYAALHVDSSYFRMVYSPKAGWGTSVILMPSFWTKSRYYQGARISYTWKIEGKDAVVNFKGSIAGLQAEGRIKLLPPRKNVFVAKVNVQVEGDVKLDKSHRYETYKPIMLSSMHISKDVWDTNKAYVGKKRYSIPGEGWLKQIPSSGKNFGLRGGSSNWKKNAPSIGIVLDKSMRVSGWITKSNNPNDDNVGFWVASRKIVRSLKYAIVVKQ